MKRQIALGLALILVVASTAVEAQLGGLLRKKAEEIAGGKKSPPKPAPSPAPAPAAEPAPAPETEATATPAAPAPSGGSARDAAPATEKTAVSPLEVSALPVRQSASQVLRDRIQPGNNGDWQQLPYIPAPAVAAAYALDDAAQVTLVETVGGALKTLLMSAAYLAEHDQWIKDEHQGVDHGLKGIVGIEEALEKNDLEALEAIQVNQVVAMGVDQAQSFPAASLKMQFDMELADWKKRASDVKRRDRAKYQKLVAKAQPLESLPPEDEKFRRGYAVLRSIDNDGPDTEDAVYAIHARQKLEKEQLAYDGHSLKGQIRQQLTAFVAIAAKVDFGAQTMEKGEKTLFVKPAYEQQGALWKACFRAGQAPTAAAVKLARAWLAEL
jgi:hypothetical protein